MKKTILMLVAVLGITAAAQAQLRPGFRLGANYSNMVNRDIPADVFKYRLGFHGGVILNFTMGDIFSIQPEILYSSKGYTYGAADHTVAGPGNTSLTVSRTGDVKLNYIDIPILFRTQAGALFFELGPQFSYLVNAKSEFQNRSGGSSQDPGPSRGDFTAFDYGLAAGVGVDLWGVNLGLRYSMGLNPIEGDNHRLHTSDTKNNVFMLSLGYLIPSGGGGGTMRPTY